MAFQTQDGARSYGSKFRTSRYDRENAPTDSGPRAKSHELMGMGSSDSAPSADSRLHKNPHSEKFNTPLDGPKASADTQEMGEEQSEAHDSASVTCPHCGGDVPMSGEGNHSDEPAPMSETEHDVKDNKVAKGVWKPGQREHPDAEKHDDFDVEPL